METFPSGGKAIRMHAIRPPTPGRHPAILLLHGSGGNVGFWLDRMSPALARFGVAAFAAHYFDRTDTQRADLRTLSDGIHVPLWLSTVRDALETVARDPAVDRSRVALVGISLGAFLALALGSEAGHPGGSGSAIRAIVEISGGLVEPYATAATEQFPPTLLVHGDGDTVVAVQHAYALEARLEELKVRHGSLILPGEGHWFSTAAQLRILAAVGDFLGKELSAGFR